MHKTHSPGHGQIHRFTKDFCKSEAFAKQKIQSIQYSLSFIHSNAFQLEYDFVSSITCLNMLRKTPASVRPTRLHRSLGTHLKAKYISKLVHYDSNTKNLNTSTYSPQIHNLPSKTIYFIHVLSIFLLNFHVSIFSACRDFRSSPGSSPQPEVTERKNGVLPALGVALRSSSSLSLKSATSSSVSTARTKSVRPRVNRGRALLFSTNQKHK